VCVADQGRHSYHFSSAYGGELIRVFEKFRYHGDPCAWGFTSAFGSAGAEGILEMKEISLSPADGGGLDI